MKDIPVPLDPTDDEALALFKSVETLFPSKTLGDNKWYILTVFITNHASNDVKY